MIYLPEPDFSCGDCTNGESAYTKEQMLSHGESCAKAEREAAMAAILEGCPNDGGDTEIILRRAWDRVRMMR